MSLTLSQVVVGQWWNLFLLLQDSNAPIMCLITSPIKTNTPMGGQMEVSYLHRVGVTAELIGKCLHWVEDSAPMVTFTEKIVLVHDFNPMEYIINLLV